MSAAVNTQSAKAHRSALLCFALALLTMATTAWFVVEGINATEPDSPARWAKVASGVLLLVLEASAFGLAGQWPEHSKVLRSLGWSVLALEITLMSVAQVSIGMTAAKSSSGGDTTISALEKKSAGARENAKRLQSRADELRATGRTANIRLAASEEKAAIKQTAIADEAETDAQKRRGNSTGTPVVEIVGKTGLIALSIALSVALSLSGIVLMHVAGSLWRRASGALPVDVQILELLQRIHGAPAAPVQATEVVAPAPAQSVAPAPAPASFKTAEPIEPKDYSSGLAYSSKIKLAGAGLLGAAGALTAPISHAAPAVPAQEKTPSVPAVAPANGVSETVHADHVNEGGADASNAAPAVLETSPAGVSKPIHDGVLKPIQQIVKKPRAKRAVSAKLDTGTDGKAGARFKRIRAGVVSGKIRPSVRGIQAVEGGSQEVVADYLTQLAADGVIVRAGRGYALAGKAGAK